MTTDLELPLFSRGKVRDTYELDSERLLMVATDRLSAFDWILPTGIPDRGKVLTQLSVFWFERTRELQVNHLLQAGDDGRSMVVRRAQRIDFECVVRGYMAGSAWAEYRAAGTMAGERLPAGLQESERLPEPLFTPATKAETGHDENVTFAQVAAAVGEELARRIRDASLALYQAGAEHSGSRGLILADTKFEFGLVDGRLCLIDEALTPDSSRYWDAERYRPGAAPPSFDKQFVRDWLAARGDWDRNSPPPALPPEIVEQTRERYLTAFERLVGRPLS
ncbi:MAG: phosphoribosylaminoimidazolesuccinocarboxamide synthase [Candidatus Dormibacteraeota bacterium]|nr:phosphoribosylaminoimidazolesuccinocarboxamide synthase [Candidatus Dormibacteraeota bacterium]